MQKFDTKIIKFLTINFKAVSLSLEQNLLTKIRTNWIFTLLPTINKSIYSNSIEFWGSVTSDFFDSILSYYLVVENYLLWKIV